MARVVCITLALLGITILGFHLTHGSMYEHVQLHLEQLSRGMAQILDSMENWDQWRNWAAQGARVLASLQHWQIWAFPGVLILFFGLIWCIKKTKFLPGSSSTIWICAAILALFLKTFIFLMKVAGMVFITVVLLEIIHLGIYLTCGDTYEHVKLHMEQLRWDMVQLLDSKVNWNQWRKWAAQGALVLASLHHWQIWALPGVLILFFGLIWCIRKTKYLPGSSSTIWNRAVIPAAFPKAFIFLMKVSRMVFITLALLGIIRLGIHLTCGDMHEHVQLHMEQLRWDMAQLLHSMVQWNQWRNWAAQGAMRIASLQHRQICAFLGVFVLFFGLILFIRKNWPRSSSIILVCAAILIVFVKTFVFIVRGAQMVFTTLAFKEIIRLAIHLTLGDIHEHVHLRMERLSWNMAQLLDSLVQRSQWQNWAAKGALLLPALQYWKICAVPGAFILFFGLVWCMRNTKYLPGSTSMTWICAAILAAFLKPYFLLRKMAEIWRSRNKEDDNDEEEESDSEETRELGRVRADSTEWPAPYMADSCQMVEELVDDLLRICRGQTCHSFTPRLQPPTGVCVYEEWSFHYDNITYRLLVPVKAPPGHTFHVELNDVEETATSKSCLRVQLQCTCTRERLLGDMLCFLHHDQEELRGKQEPSLLDTFCTGSYLDVEKSMLWLQDQVKAAWRHLPQSCDCLLELLPSSHSCKIQLTAPSNCTFNIEMTLGVLLDESGTFLSIE